MMAAKSDPVSSPDFLGAPRRGKGVRRLNRLPLMIVGGLVLLAVAGMSYTMLQRQLAAQRTAAETEPSPVQDMATSPIQRPGGPDYVEPPVPPPFPGPLDMPRERSDSPVAIQTQAQTRSPELEQRLRLIARIEENRLMAREAALGADLSVQFRGQSGNAQNNRQGAGLDLAGLLGTNSGSGAEAAAALFNNMNRPEDPNRQDEKREFLSNVQPQDTYLNHTRTPALAPTEVKAGTVIPGVMIGGVNSDLPGQIIGQVRQNVYDTATGLHLLIPAGARLVGTYDSRVTMGQRRVLVAWNRVIYPDGSSVSLDLMPGADLSGYAGFKDKVNSHYWRIFGNAFMLSLFSSGIQLSQPRTPAGGTYDSQQIMAAEIGRQLGELGEEVARRNLNIQPTLEIRPGYMFNIMVTKDMILPTWQGHPLAAGQRR